MTGAYLRVQRDGQWVNVEIEYLTREELREQMLPRDQEGLLRWIEMLCTTIREAEGGPPAAGDTSPPSASS